MLDARSFTNNLSPHCTLFSPLSFYSLTARTQMPRKTMARGVVPDIPYYVSANFQAAYPTFSDNFRRVEKAVEVEFRDKLALDCGSEKQRKNGLLYQVSDVV